MTTDNANDNDNDNEELIAAYGLAHYDYNAISAKRRRQQPNVLLAFAAHIDKPFVEAEGRDLRSYLSTRLADGIAPTTLGKNLAMIRPFFAWLYSEKLIDAAALLDLREVKPPRGAHSGVPKPYSAKEITRFWKAVESTYPWVRPRAYDLNRGQTFADGQRWVKRWQKGTSEWSRVAAFAFRTQVEAVIALAIYGGLRQDEIYRLEVEEMHYENAYVLVRGARKNREGEVRLRTVPWTVPPMREAVQRWLDLREVIGDVMGPLTHDRPWLTLRQIQYVTNPMTPRSFSMLVCTTGKGWQFHRLRHTAATELLRARYPLELVQKILGHSDVSQTLRYAKLVTDDVLNQARRSEATLAGRMERLRPQEVVV